MSIIGATDRNAAGEPRTQAPEDGGLRRHLARQLILEVALPLAGYYAGPAPRV